MNPENCEKVLQIIQSTSSFKFTRFNGNDLGKLLDSAQSGNEMAFVYLAEWFFSYDQLHGEGSPFEVALHETLKPYFEN